MIGMTRANAVNAFGNLLFHWPEYLMEAGELGLYMFSTCAIATLLQHPASPVRHVIANSFFRRAVMGLAWAPLLSRLSPHLGVSSPELISIRA